MGSGRTLRDPGRGGTRPPFPALQPPPADHNQGCGAAVARRRGARTKLIHLGLDEGVGRAAAGGGDVEEQVVPVEGEGVEVEPVHRVRARRLPPQPPHQVPPHENRVLRQAAG